MPRALILMLALAACSTEANHLGNPLLLPVYGITSAVGNAAYDSRRGQVELMVKSNHPRLLDDIAAGGGPVLTEAFGTAGVPDGDRAARRLQLQRDLGLYQANPGALVVALMVYGG